MDYYGYAGSILYVDLSSGEIKKELLDLKDARDFIGGFGINHKLAYELVTPHTDPLSSQNPIIIGAGPLTGTLSPGASRVAATTRFPLTRAIASASGSMAFAAMLKWAGYDHVVITGRANHPVYLKIADDDVEVCDASNYWGKDIHETTDDLKSKYGRCSIIAIGQAGEKLVKFSLSFVDKAASLGSGGFGAVMGSKNLKAIVAKGTKGVKVSDSKRFMKAVNSLFERAKKWSHLEATVKLGIMSNWSNFVHQIFPYRNWNEVYPANKATELYGPQLYDRMKKKAMACPSCFACDKEILEIKEGEFAGLVHPTPSFLDAGMTGTRWDVDDYASGLKLLSLLDRYGLCCQTFNSLGDFVVDLYERGIVTSEDTGGLVLKRDFDTALTLIEQITHREGFGDVLAGGWQEAISRIGKGSEKYSLAIKGKDALWDPRLSGLGTLEFEQIVSPRGPASATGGSPSYVLGQPLDVFKRQTERMVPYKEAFERIFDSPLGFNVGRLTRYAEDWMTILSCLGICGRASINRFYHIDILAELYSAATGIELSPQELMRCAERAWNLYKVLNVREGFSRKDDVIPQNWFQPMKTAEGKEAPLTDYYKTKVLSKEELEALLNDYYDERGWDIQKGIPARQKLIDLGLDKVAEDLKEALE